MAESDLHASLAPAAVPAGDAARRDGMRLRFLARALAEIVWVTDADGRTYDLPEWCAYTGQTQEEVRGYGWLNALHPDDRERTARAWNAAIRSGGEARYDVEYRVRGKDGVYRWFNARGAPVPDGMGGILEWVGVCINIDAHKRADDERERLLAEVELERTRFRNTFEQAAAGIAHVGLDGHWLRVNDRLCDFLGRTRDELMRLSFQDVTHPDDLDADVALMDRLLAGEVASYAMEKRYLLPDGSPAWATLTVALVRTADGRPDYFISVVQDIAQQKEVEERLRESETRFRALADNIPQLAWMTDADGWIVWYNRRWLEYTGTTLEEMQGWGWTEVHHPDHVDRVVHSFRSAIEAGASWEDTFPLRSASGEYRWFLSRAHPIRDPSGNVTRWFGTNTDITVDRETAAERERLFEKVRAASEAKSDFMATVSHELRTPLNAIIGYADLLQMGVPAELPAGACGAVERIRLAANHQRQLIDDILAFSRIDAGREQLEVERVQVRTVLQEIDAVIAPLAAGKGLRLAIPHADGDGDLQTDPRKLRQILVNLLGNAVKFTDAGSVELRVDTRDDEIRWIVEDTGVGIPADKIERVFDPFWQADGSLTRRAGGSGLGLSISQRYARMLGGDISVASEVGRGSRFTLRLPRHDPPG